MFLISLALNLDVIWTSVTIDWGMLNVLTISEWNIPSVHWLTSSQRKTDIALDTFMTSMCCSTTYQYFYMLLNVSVCIDNNYNYLNVAFWWYLSKNNNLQLLSWNIVREKINDSWLWSNWFLFDFPCFFLLAIYNFQLNPCMSVGVYSLHVRNKIWLNKININILHYFEVYGRPVKRRRIVWF